jgi:hypothetical protein
MSFSGHKKMSKTVENAHENGQEPYKKELQKQALVSRYTATDVCKAPMHMFRECFILVSTKTIQIYSKISDNWKLG